MFDLATTRIGIVGLGYVGLPLAVEFGKQFPTIGLDINAARIRELQAGSDSTLEVAPEELRQARHLLYTDRAEDLANAMSTSLRCRLRWTTTSVRISVR